jgi:FtsH-binding integral membrane protein
METVSLRQTQGVVRVNSFVRSVYNWMAIGLAITGFTAYAVANSPEVQRVIFGSGIVFFGLILAQLAMVFMISGRIYKMQSSTATTLFIVYSALNGATLSAIFMAYAASTITSTFFVCWRKPRISGSPSSRSA